MSETKTIGNILSFEQLENKVTTDIQDIFTSACAYFDIKRIETCLKEKIIPNMQHFYILITAYVGVKNRINNGKTKAGKKYKYHAATGTSISSDWREECIMCHKDFYFKYMVNELLDTLKLFVANGFVLTMQTYNILIFLNIDLSSIDHLFTLTPKEKKKFK